MSYIDNLINEKLGGDENRVAELFYDNAVFNELVAQGKDSDWYHFEHKTFDGEYFVKTNNGYACYQQERGKMSQSMSFGNIHEAAIFYFTQAGYIKPQKKSINKWWQFWK